MNKVTDVVIAHNSVISLHVQLHNQLRHLILSGHWTNGSRIPSENQFAEHLSLSRSTVRLALQQAEIEGLIERIAGRGAFVTYQPAKAQRPHLIAFLTCGFDAENHLLILNGAENEVRARGYQLVFNNAQNHQEEIDILKRLKEENIAGVLLWPIINSTRTRQRDAVIYQQFGLPIVLMDRKIDGFECDYVTSDNYGGAHVLVQHLLDLGHQHIVFLSHREMSLLPVSERYRAYCNVLQEAAMPLPDPWLIGPTGREISASYALRASVDPKNPEIQQIKALIAKAHPRPTAIFAMNDYLAVMAMRTMKLLDLAVPDSMSITGFDDIDLAVHLETPLTTVAQDPFTIGKRAAQLLINRIEGYTGPTTCEIIPTQLRVRGSTAVPISV